MNHLHGLRTHVSAQEKSCFPFYVPFSMMKGNPDLHLNGFVSAVTVPSFSSWLPNQKYAHRFSEEKTIDIVQQYDLALALMFYWTLNQKLVLSLNENE